MSVFPTIRTVALEFTFTALAITFVGAAAWFATVSPPVTFNSAVRASTWFAIRPLSVWTRHLANLHRSGLTGMPHGCVDEVHNASTQRGIGVELGGSHEDIRLHL